MGIASFYSLSSSNNTQMENPAEEFEEEEIWAVVPSEANTGDPRFRAQEIRRVREIASTPRRLPTASRMIPRRLANEESANNVARIKHQSAPVNIPNWSRVHRRENQRKMNPEIEDGFGTRRGNQKRMLPEIEDGFGIKEDDDAEEDEDERIPPHEMIARQLARSQITSFSVFEGVGRTLKGRDLSRVRNAVLTRTGFLE